MAGHDPPGRTEIEGVTRLLSGAAGEPQRLIALHRVRASTFNAASLDERRRAVPVPGQQRSSNGAAPETQPLEICCSRLPRPLALNCELVSSAQSRLSTVLASTSSSRLASTSAPSVGHLATSALAPSRSAVW